MTLEQLKSTAIDELHLCEESSEKFPISLMEYMYYREYYLEYLNNKSYGVSVKE